MNLEEATRVTGEPGTYEVTISRDWEIWGPNGGYLAALALRAVGEVAEIRTPSSLYCHFLSSPQFASAQLEVTPLKRGRRSESFSVCMKQLGKPVLQALVRTATEAPGYEFQHVTAPTVAAPHELKPWQEIWANHSGPRYTFWNNLDARPIEQTPSLASGPAIRRDWIRFQPQACFDDPFVDGARSLILLDTYGWPAAWRANANNAYYAPNLDTSVWFHQSSRSSEWLLIDHECSVAHGGLMGVNGKVWDEQGRLIATGSAQLCCLPGR